MFIDITELQIGDLVRTKVTGKIIKVGGIGRGAVTYDCGYSINSDELEGIPITDEILAASDFEDVGCSHWAHMEDNISRLQLLHKGNGYYPLVNDEPWQAYDLLDIHHLQHLMKAICITPNFVIGK